MTITAFIPARGGSKGIKDKNITPLCGKPLIFWVLQALNFSNQAEKIIVATDSDKIEQVVNSFKFEKVSVYRREPKNAQDKSPTIDVVLEYINFAKLNKEDLFFLAQTTSPLLTSEEVDDFITKFKSAREVSSSFSCTEFKRICWREDGTPINHDLKKRQQRQNIEKILVENGAMYINSVANITSEKSLLSGKVLPYIMPQETSTEIDEPEDLVIVEKLLAQKLKN
jgi:N-acylneuraminate cytidylyltransferase